MPPENNFFLNAIFTIEVWKIKLKIKTDFQPLKLFSKNQRTTCIRSHLWRSKGHLMPYTHGVLRKSVVTSFPSSPVTAIRRNLIEPKSEESRFITDMCNKELCLIRPLFAQVFSFLQFETWTPLKVIYLWGFNTRIQSIHKSSSLHSKEKNLLKRTLTQIFALQNCLNSKTETLYWGKYIVFLISLCHSFQCCHPSRNIRMSQRNKTYLSNAKLVKYLTLLHLKIIHS